MSSPRACPELVLLETGQLLASGGLPGIVGNFSSDIAELSNGRGRGWEVVDHLNLTRAFHTATRLNDGSVLVVGGTTNTGQPTRTAELYRMTAFADPATN